MECAPKERIFLLWRFYGVFVFAAQLKARKSCGNYFKFAQFLFIFLIIYAIIYSGGLY